MIGSASSVAKAGTRRTATAPAPPPAAPPPRRRHREPDTFEPGSTALLYLMLVSRSGEMAQRTDPLHGTGANAAPFYD